MGCAHRVVAALERRRDAAAADRQRVLTVRSRSDRDGPGRPVRVAAHPDHDRVDQPARSALDQPVQIAVLTEVSRSVAEAVEDANPDQLAAVPRIEPELARQIHEASQRAAHVFLPVNCGAIPENLIESELFGHVKGAFTGADRARKGLFQQADGATIFLDEIRELPLHLQVKLLHVLEEKAVRPVGSEEHKPVDVRIVAATNRDLETMVRDGKFREDLFFRLSIFRLALPPLRDRPRDIVDLIDHFAKVWHRETGRTAVFDEAAKKALAAYAWPGNVRQLDNVISRVLLLAESDQITIADIPSDILGRRAPVESRGPGGAAPAGESGSLRERMRHHEARLIAEALKQAGGDKRSAATVLGIGLSSLYRKIDELNDIGLFGERE